MKVVIVGGVAGGASAAARIRRLDEHAQIVMINFKAPIIVNADTLKGVQLIADNNDYEVRYPIYSILEERKGE